MLEVIDKGRCTHTHPIPILFIHGGWHAAWCWDEHFLNFFADKGYRAIAVSLRGHGGSPTTKPLNSCSVADYVDDVRSVAEGLATEPILVGHSMGGYVAQKYLECHPATAAVLMASAPPHNFLNSLGLCLRHPSATLRMTTTGRASTFYDSAAKVRQFLFSANTPESVVQQCFARLGDESMRVLFLDMPAINRVRPRRVSTPMLVLGADDDGAIRRRALRVTARAYDTEPEFFHDIGHDMMLEPQWRVVAERIHSWLSTLQSGKPRVRM